MEGVVDLIGDERNLGILFQSSLSRPNKLEKCVLREFSMKSVN